MTSQPLDAHENRLLEQFLSDRLPAQPGPSSRLLAAMRYAVLGGGKRLRPALVIHTAGLFHVAATDVLVPAGAIELIHAYSLIHDDLPAMDDDDLRRGQPTCHRAFDEATAILAGDALQALAFEWLAAHGNFSPEQRLAMLQSLTRASGHAGMVGGQAIDLGAVGQSLDLPALENMHRHKTGALIQASVRLGVIASGQTDTGLLATLDRYADALGLAFQVQDDILDVEGSTEVLGKQQGADMARQKPTYPALLGTDGARQLLDQLRLIAHSALDELPGDTGKLRNLADFTAKRAY